MADSMTLLVGEKEYGYGSDHRRHGSLQQPGQIHIRSPDALHVLYGTSPL